MKCKLAKMFLLCGLGIVLACPAQAFSFYGVISADTTWSDTVNVTGDVFVDSGAILNMLPGTTVLFADTTVWDTSYGIGKECDLIVRGEVNIIGDELNKVYLTSSGRWGTLKMMNGSVEDSIIYAQIEKNTVGLWMDSTNVFIKHTIFNNIFNSDYQDTLPEYFGSGIYAHNCNIIIDSCFISNCGKSYTGQATGIYLENTNAYVVNNSIINIWGSGYKYEFPSAYGIYMIGGDSLFCLNNFIANIKGGGMGVADLVRGGDGIGIYRKSGFYTQIEKTHIQTCIGGNGVWADSYLEDNGGDGGVGIGIFIDSSCADIHNSFIDTCIGGDGGIVSKKGKTTYGGDGGDGICIKYRYSFGVLNSDTILYSHGGLGGWGFVSAVNGVSGMGNGLMLENNSNVTIGGSSDKRCIIYGSTGYYLYNNTGNNINATYNFWGTNDTTLIRAKIYDHFVNGTKGYVFITPNIKGPELISPANRTFSNDSTFAFIWCPADSGAFDIGGYLFQVSTDSGFKAYTLDTTLSDTALTLILSATDTIYYWRVLILDIYGNPGAFSATWKLEIDVNDPAVPGLVSPPNCQWVPDTSVVISWTTVVKKDKASDVLYVIQVDQDTSFSSPVVIETTATNTDTLYLSEGPYCWRVMAYDLAGNYGTYSFCRLLGVDTTDPNVHYVLALPDDASAPYGPYEVSSKADDLSGIALGVMFIQVNGGNWNSTPMSIAYDSLQGGIPDLNPAVNETITVCYYVKASDMAGNEGASATYSFKAIGPLGVEGNPGSSVPSVFALNGAYPNPSKGQTTFKYQLPKISNVSLTVYNIAGQAVKRFDLGTKPAGYHSVNWNGNQAAAGVYFYRLQAGDFSSTKKLMIVR